MFKVYHWDTFDGETFLIARVRTLEEAEKVVLERYAGRIHPQGADKVEVVDKQGDVVRQWSVK